LGAKIVDTKNGLIECKADKLTGCEIDLDYPSVGATENIMLASVFAKGETVIRNAAKEPEIVDLQDFLSAMGARVSGAGTETVNVSGVDSLHSRVEHEVIPDRIVACTYLAAAAAAGGELLITKTCPGHMSAVLSKLTECGCEIKTEKDSVFIAAPEGLSAISAIRTQPYPGFPTDMQSQIAALMVRAKGTSVIIETVFENRFNYTEELVKMGANIIVEGRTAVVQGVDKLYGANVNSRDLRGGAAIVLAALGAEGITTITATRHIDRGYEDIEKALTLAGAGIWRM
jgi:UDP-N-acetylglucosamine 1-carboxyvinyltransferase